MMLGKNNKDKMNQIVSQILFYFILCQPIIDVFTSLNENFIKAPISLGIVIRSLFMVFAAFVTLYYSWTEKKWFNLFYLFLTGFYCIAYLIISLIRNDLSTMMIDIMGLVKTFYFAFVLNMFLVIYQKLDMNKIKNAVLVCAGLYTCSIVVAVLTGTSFATYKNANTGYVGWFYAGNEVGAILALLLPVFCCFLFMSKKVRIRDLILGLCVGATTTLVGVRTVFLSIIIFLGLCMVWSVLNAFIHFKNKKINKKIYVKTFTMCMVLVCVIQVMYHMSFIKDNMQMHETEHVETPVEEEEEHVEENATFQKFDMILNHRLTYMIPKMNYYKQCATVDKAFGIGYTHGEGKDESQKMVEIDMLDIFFAHGWIGFIIYFMPIIFFALRFLYLYFKNLALNFSNLETCTFMYSLFISLGISCTAGHLFTAPAVSIYMAILIMLLICRYSEVQKEKNCMKSTLDN